MDWQIRHSVLSLDQPKIMGILNVTPDSFSDGGIYLSPQAALERALKMEEEGMDILDIGAESTRPGAVAVEVEEEWRRLGPVVKAIRNCVKVPISVDTRKGEIARRALDAGVDIVNDVSCASTPDLLGAVAESKAAYVLMHSRGDPRNMGERTIYCDFMDELIGELSVGLGRAREMGIHESRIILDPGFGFAKTSEQNWELLGKLEKLNSLDYPWMVGLSRKNFLREMTGESLDVLVPASVSAGILAVQAGAGLLRVHDVGTTRRALKAFQISANRLQSET